MRSRFSAIGSLNGSLAPPPDKSMSHRAALIAAMSSEPVEIRNYLLADDTLATLRAIRALGCEATYKESGGPAGKAMSGGRHGLAGEAVTEVPGGLESKVFSGERGSGGEAIHAGQRSLDLTVHGVGVRGAGSPEDTIDVGNAGTLLRLLPGWLAGQAGQRFTLDGDESIRRRPVDRVVEPLKMMGGSVEAREGRLPPLLVEGTELHGVEYRLPVASAQVKSCVLLAGLTASGETAVIESLPSRDHTERLIEWSGVPIFVGPLEKEGQRGQGAAADRGGPRTEAGREDLRTAASRGGLRVTVAGVEAVSPGPIRIPGDISAAAFWLVAATIVEGSEIRLGDVGVNPTRTGVLDVLERMGGKAEVVSLKDSGGFDSCEPRGEILVRSADLGGTVVEPDEVPRLIDELPLVALLGAFAEGETVVRGAGELRHKESDRIATVVAGLKGVGVDIQATDDGFVVEGSGGLRGGGMDAAGDHRIAMMGAIAGLTSTEGVIMDGMEAAAVSYPGFEADLERLAG